MRFSNLLVLSLSTLPLALPSPSTRVCTPVRTVSDPGFYVSASLPTADFPDDPPYYENQMLEFQPTPASADSRCTLFGNFERGFPVSVSGNGGTKLNVYQRRSTGKKLVGSFSGLQIEEGKTTDIVSSPIAEFGCGEGAVFEFELAVEGAGAWGSVAFQEDAESGFSILAC